MLLFLASMLQTEERQADALPDTTNESGSGRQKARHLLVDSSRSQDIPKHSLMKHSNGVFCCLSSLSVWSLRQSGVKQSRESQRGSGQKKSVRVGANSNR